MERGKVTAHVTATADRRWGEVRYIRLKLTSRVNQFTYRLVYLFVSWSLTLYGGPASAAPPLFRPGNPALCGSRPLVAPYYCRLGDLPCFVFMSAYCMFDLSVYYLFLQYFDTVGWVFWPVKKRLPYNLYCVGGDVKHCSIQSNPLTLYGGGDCCDSIASDL